MVATAKAALWGGLAILALLGSKPKKATIAIDSSNIKPTGKRGQAYDFDLAKEAGRLRMDVTADTHEAVFFDISGRLLGDEKEISEAQAKIIAREDGTWDTFALYFGGAK